MVLVDAGQCLLQATDFLVPHALPTRRSARNQEEAWPGQLRTSCPIYKLGRAGKDRPVPALGWGGHPSWVVCKGIVHHSSFLGFTPLVVIISKFISIIKLFLSQSMDMGMIFFFSFLSHATGESGD